MREKELLISIDGELVPKSLAKISVYDHGLLYGDGVFEGIRAYDGVVFKLKEHIDRLFKSAHMIMLEIPLTREEIIQEVIKTLIKNELKDAYIRLVVTRGEGDLGLDPRKCKKPTVVIIADKIKLLDEETRNRGASVIISWVRRNQADATPPGVKSLNYLNNIMAKIEANNAGADEAIFLNQNGFTSEGVGENVFLGKDGKLYTPPSCCGALPGITQARIVKLAEELGFVVEEKNITPADLFSADELFFSGTAAEIVPIREVNKRVIGDGKPGPITKLLMKAFEKLTRNPEEGMPYDLEFVTDLSPQK